MTHEEYLTDLICGFHDRGHSWNYPDPVHSGSSERDAVARWLAEHVSNYLPDYLPDARRITVDYCRAWKRWDRDGAEDVDLRIRVRRWGNYQLKVCVLNRSPNYRYELWDWLQRSFEWVLGARTEQSGRMLIRDCSEVHTVYMADIRWIEIEPELYVASLAGHSDLPERDLRGRPIEIRFGQSERGEGGSSEGEGAAAVVQFASRAANIWSLNHRIKRELGRLVPQVLRQMPPTGGGVLAVVDIETNTETEAAMFRGCSLIGPFQRPEEGIESYTPDRYLMPAPANRQGRIEHRFFWAVRE